MGGAGLVYMVKRCAASGAASRKDGAMLAEERVRQEPRTEERARQEPRQEWLVPDFWQRAIFVGIGTAIWVTGFMLMLSILLVFIGLPLFFFGLAMTEAGLRGWR
jgi:hypothetical protein